MQTKTLVNASGIFRDSAASFFRSSVGRFLLALVSVFWLILPGAMAAELTNSGFEDGLNGWTAAVVKDGTVNAPKDCKESPSIESPCIVDGVDSFSITGSSGAKESVAVSPNNGKKMLRLGGPFKSSNESQSKGTTARVQQKFTVTADTAKVNFAYNLFTWDYAGFDELDFIVKVKDESGKIISESKQGSFGVGTNLKSSGWQPISLDLSGFIGEELLISIESRGSKDDLFGMWAYIDDGQPKALNGPSGTTSSTPAKLADGSAVSLASYKSYVDNTTELVIPQSQAQTFKDGLPLSFKFNLNAAAGAQISDVKLLGDGISAPAVKAVDGTWSAELKVKSSLKLTIQYTVIESGYTTVYTVPFASIVLIDPQGVVYDQTKFDQLVASGTPKDQALAMAALQGAKVQLQRKQTDGSWKNVLASDPGIAPHVAPQITGKDGKYQWDVSAGTYRVTATLDGYSSKTTSELKIPPPVLDAHIGLKKATVGGGTETQPATSPDKDDPAARVKQPTAKIAKTSVKRAKGLAVNLYNFTKGSKIKVKWASKKSTAKLKSAAKKATRTYTVNGARLKVAAPKLPGKYSLVLRLSDDRMLVNKLVTVK